MPAGRPPSPPGTRARRNAGQADWQTVTGSRAPAWPGAKTDPAEARSYWRTVWSELGGMWSSADRMPVYRAAMLHAAVVASVRRKGMARGLQRIARNKDLAEKDRAFLSGLALEFAVGEPAAAAAKELRELEDRLGISPGSRRRLQWELVRGTGKTPSAAAPATDSARAKRSTSTGNVLSALK